MILNSVSFLKIIKEIKYEIIWICKKFFINLEGPNGVPGPPGAR